MDLDFFFVTGTDWQAMYAHGDEEAQPPITADTCVCCVRCAWGVRCVCWVRRVCVFCVIFCLLERMPAGVVTWGDVLRTCARVPHQRHSKGALYVNPYMLQ